MKKLLLLCLIYISSHTYAQQHTLEKLWETDTIIAIPESVLPDIKNKILYVSLIDGPAWAADGKGGIGKITADGKIIDANWITGLNAPKGLAMAGNRLYVADITEVIVVNIKKGKIEKRIKVDSAIALNDVTINDKGVVFISDSRAGKIYSIEKDIPALYLSGMPNVNGLKAIGTDLIIASGKNFVKADARKNITPIATLPQGGDGIEPIGNGDFLVTAWVGYVFYVFADGKTETLLETHMQKKNTADIGYDPATRIMYLPTFNGKTVAAYRLK